MAAGLGAGTQENKGIDMRAIDRLLPGLLAAALGTSTAAAAEQPAPVQGGLEEIVVTAQKRAESEQSVPLSMTTFGAVALEQKAVTAFFDYGTKVPNLAFAPTGDGVGTSRTISIRGISGDNVTGFYVDDTPLPDSIDPRILDVDHIEVLRGPQGTLYGARSMGGTVRIITKQANLSEFEATVHGGAGKTSGTDRANFTGDGVVNIPLVQDTAALRLSGFYDEQAGFFKRSYCTDPATAGVSCTPLSTTGITTVKNVGMTDTYGGAVTLTWKVSDDVTITPRIMVQRESYNGFPMADYLSAPNNGVGYPFGPMYADATNLPSAMKPTNFTQARWFNVPEGGSDEWHLYSLNLHWKTGLGDLVSSTAYFDRRVDETEDETDFVWGAITSNFGTLPNCGSATTAFNWCSLPSAGGITEIKAYQRFAQEVRFASDLKGPMQFVVGAFYSDFHGRLPFAAYYPPATVPGLDAALGGPNNPDYADLVFSSDYHTAVKEPAVFGEVSWKATDALKVTGGLRWYQVKTTAYGYQEGLAVGGGPAIVDPSTTNTESGVNPKVQVDYHFTPDKMAYVMVAKGFRPGGLVPSVPAGVPGTPLDCVAELLNIDPNLTLQATRRFKSDSLWNYELGAKTAWLDNRLTLNAATFFIKWKDIQQQILLGCGFQYRANAGGAESKGGEVELRARPTEHLEVSAGIGYQDAKITQASNTSPQQVGSPVYQVPDWTGNASLTYSTAITTTWRFVGGIDWAYIGRSYSGNNQPTDPRLRDAYNLLDMRLALTHGSIEYALVGKNLADEHANLGDSRSIAAETPGRPRLLVNQPRTFGVEFRAKF
ncbi:MAG: TonB-dependent receptor [Proteobacteria bacterium]|nr:TonB-dependent receptor [Pseudomonadota bacterium]